MTQSPTDTLGRVGHWLFRDRRTGAITIAQAPNLPLWLFLGFTLATWVAHGSEPTAFWLSLGADLALAWWAVDELVRGVNPWRRFLGGATLVGLVALLAWRAAA